MPRYKKNSKRNKDSSLHRLINIPYAKPGVSSPRPSEDLTKSLPETPAKCPSETPAECSAEDTAEDTVEDTATSPPNTKHQCPNATQDIDPLVQLAQIPDFATESELGLYLLQHKRKSNLAQAQISQQYPQWINRPLGNRSNLTKYNGRTVQYIIDEATILALDATVGKDAPGKCCGMHRDLLHCVPEGGLLRIKPCGCVFCKD